jgi:hypothetical protein
MDQKSYVICATYGEYDDFNRLPIFVCQTKMELDLFIDALYKKEQPYWSKVVDFFANMCSTTAREYCVPEGLGFEWHEVDLLTLCDKHHAT